MKGNIQQNPDYKAGYSACEAEKHFDENQSDTWKEGYHDKEKERFIRSVKYHLARVSGQEKCCCALMDNPSKITGTEYRCYYYGKGCKGNHCYDEMLSDFLRLYADSK